ncbi:endonuclease/exonuclease/phosphatase family protein [Phaeobacter sp. QD34_3]|uniref:endonuclease/exonuclease/phosphatase family protein n=1 Tax=unclassified Phaeobacter TaxID=2621772 RepID=UPI00237F0689|nr:MULTISPECIES: endonuclease/exonuclease/phosphatase family protein [unclassified Phaeobacter]MDE4133228.1 endonuclease/exonuclease/phosphatase family protein [Phaeobacter sp. QD34_3]MDE4136985.1 endonuclease/exonuclease/phosphatase family protein [Phaeobacter sp. QD34_24]
MDLNAALYLLACLVPLLTVPPLLRHEAWWVRGFEFPAVQIASLTFVVLLLFIWGIGWQTGWDRAVILALAVSLAIQMRRVLPYSMLFPHQIQTARQSRPKDQLNLLVANVLMTNRDARPLLDLVERQAPDLLLTLETDDWWQQQLAGIEESYPFVVKCPLDNLYGMHLYSRLELAGADIAYLVEEGVPSIHADVILRSGARVRLHCLHPAPPSPTENATSAERDGELLRVARDVDPGAGPVVVMGDLNDVAWSPSTRLFQKVSGLLDPRIGRGLFSTFHAGYPLLRWPLDHVFCSGDFTLVRIARLAHIGSDHFPLQVVLQHTPGARALQPEPEASPQEAERAEEKIAQVGAGPTPL